MKFDDYFNKIGVFQVHVSKPLAFFTRKICRHYNLTTKYDKRSPLLVFGVYDRNDLLMLRDHESAKYVLWGGTDADVRYNPGNKKYVFEKVKEFDIAKHFSSSADLHKRLLDQNIQNTKLFIDFSQYDPQFKIRIPLKSRGKKIYIYNGLSEGQEEKYGKSIYEEVVKRVDHEVIYSNKERVDQDKVFDLYKQCFIGLRLTEHDACAQTALEMKRIGLPIVHNGDYDNCIPWKTADDVVDAINVEFCRCFWGS